MPPTLLPERLPATMLAPVTGALARIGVTPAGLTWAGLLGNVVAAVLIGRGDLLAGGVVMLLASGLDLLDGALARATGRASDAGALLDSTLDRASEAVVLFGLLVYAFDRGEREESLLIFAAISGALLVSYVRARGEALGVKITSGLFRRQERVVLLAAGLITGWVRPALWVLAVLSILTAAQRLWLGLRALDAGEQHQEQDSEQDSGQRGEQHRDGEQTTPTGAAPEPGAAPAPPSGAPSGSPPGQKSAEQPAENQLRLTREDRTALAGFLAKNLSGRVAIELWTRQHSGLVVPGREPCTYCEETELAARQIAALHGGISLTLYDIDRHAERAAEAGIERPPTTVLRGPRGVAAHFTGLFAGALFTPFIDGVVIAGAGAAPFAEESMRVLAALEQDHTIEGFVAPYDRYSGMQLQLLLALGTVSPKLWVRVTEVAEFPRLAAARGITELPTVVIDGRREGGLWTEADLIERLRRIDAGDDEPVLREQVLAVPYRPMPPARPGGTPGLAGGAGVPPGLAGGGSGLVVPGR